MSGAVIATAISSFAGFLLNSSILTVVLWRGRRLYHYVFAGYLFICALWDLGILLSMVRNDYVDELPTYGTIVWWPCTFMTAIIYTFACLYLAQPRKWRVTFLWVVSTGVFVLGVAGLGGRMIGAYDYSWGHIYRPDATLLNTTLVGLPLMSIFGVAALWYLYRGYRRESSPLRRRHLLYILVSFTIVQLATVKVAVLYGLDLAFLMPTCMFVNDVAAALVGIAIVKDRFMDITVVIRKATVYSLLGALVLLVFALSEHLLATLVGEALGESSMVTYLISVAAVIAVAMPVRKRVERTVDRFFAEKSLSF
jgi:hypothetical protein